MLEILHLDELMVAVDKPAGLLVHRTGLDAGETRFALQLLRDQLGRHVWPVHRLDKGTSGVLLFALDAGTAGLLGRRFEAGAALRKTYLGMVRGWPAAEGLVDHPLRRLADDARRGSDEIQDARTRFRTLARHELALPCARFPTTRCALVELEPLSGRRHQLRRHMKHIAHPLIGDATHGKGRLNRALAGLLGLQRLWLHALRLEIEHPADGRMLRIEAPLGPEWQAWAQHAVPAPAG
ncbi:pseudouridine synthase [Quisquiliibacterium transsilvanicum]|uniref:tRNA pseudouridine synthase C n=1 Tax=Quisquiliibacterium transsilvanicum TaxID=1549638 RepID=A0A7W8MA69_9BURK|nr:pseudouridine synthase [Quisquiliibacterium transsilvanicum]MBB5273613.1 tRNA pseudouridine65 synthase [Quisquiliibacterium transsilvanicum]